MSAWSAEVRYAEIDGQGVVFNAHYLTYCDEAMAHFCRERGLAEFAADVQLVASNLSWTSAARWGDTIEVDAACTKVGRTSFVLAFDLRVGTRTCCRVETTYVHIDKNGRPTPVTDGDRVKLS